MRTLDQILPAAEILEKLPDAQFSALCSRNLPEIVRLKAMTMFELGITTWHAAMISGKFNVHPNMLGQLVDRREPNLLKHVSRALNRKVLFDISYRYATKFARRWSRGLRR
ncbi:hypothetical protein CN120_20290 [Sinorhizobium meliloti]|uniref:hypothetical protein n=1 Tax=Rhizobium meliloti TaxID=382 RepID=UPI000FD8DC9B|nr:hypothetical protein [Sinorhizobium meliloti]RVN01754.1 hypothetical protein CN120_20290 [Sinorhizobium meliloti]